MGAEKERCTKVQVNSGTCAEQKYHNTQKASGAQYVVADGMVPGVRKPVNVLRTARTLYVPRRRCTAKPTAYLNYRLKMLTVHTSDHSKW